jgi:hypothetical protein
VADSQASAYLELLVLRRLDGSIRREFLDDSDCSVELLLYVDHGECELGVRVKMGAMGVMVTASSDRSPKNDRASLSRRNGGEACLPNDECGATPISVPAPCPSIGVLRRGSA